MRFQQQKDRAIGEGFGGYLRSKKDIGRTATTVDFSNLEKHAELKFNTSRNSQQVPALDKQTPRDMALYNQTDFMYNIYLENTKEKRAQEWDRIKTLRSMGSAKKKLVTPLSEDLLGLSPERKR